MNGNHVVCILIHTIIVTNVKKQCWTHNNCYIIELNVIELYYLKLYYLKYKVLPFRKLTLND